jgi:hypothetical protein
LFRSKRNRDKPIRNSNSYCSPKAVNIGENHTAEQKGKTFSSSQCTVENITGPVLSGWYEVEQKLG